MLNPNIPEYPEEIQGFKTSYNNLTPLRRFFQIPSQFGEQLGDNMSALQIFRLAVNSLPDTPRTEAWAELDSYGFLDNVAFNDVAIHPNPMGIPHGFIALLNEGLFDTPGINSNHDAILTNQDPTFAARVLVVLNRASILTNANRRAVATHPHVQLLHFVLTCLSQTGQFNIKPSCCSWLFAPSIHNISTDETAQLNFEATITYSRILFGTDEARDLWLHLPADTLTPSRWDSILTDIWMNRHDVEDAREVFVRDMRNLLGMRLRPHRFANGTHSVSYETTPVASPRATQSMFNNRVAPEPAAVEHVELTATGTLT